MWKFLFMERVSHGVQRTSAVQNTAEYQNSINTTTAPSPLPHYNDVFQRDMYARVEFTNTIIVKVPLLQCVVVNTARLSKRWTALHIV